jgi:hypothetical protein
MRIFHIGLDLDNTIINYDDAFAEVGAEIGLLPPHHGLRTKDEVKSFLINPGRGEQDWMRLQGQVYGSRINSAQLYAGVAEFIRAMQKNGARLSIISHKTKYGHFDAAQVNLLDAARGWLEQRGFFAEDGFNLDPKDVHFLETRDEKVATIVKIGCQIFVDDLPEVLLHPSFPAQALGFWFAGDKAASDGLGLVPYRNWTDIRKVIEKLMAAGERGI